jgi:hypothetical protein
VKNEPTTSEEVRTNAVDGTFDVEGIDVDAEGRVNMAKARVNIAKARIEAYRIMAARGGPEPNTNCHFCNAVAGCGGENAVEGCGRTIREKRSYHQRGSIS